MDLRLMVITDAAIAAPRPVRDIVEEALCAGAPAIQLRDKTATAAELFEQATSLLELTRAHRALLFINDRLDVALAAHADGVHLGPDDLPIAAARRVAPEAFLIGFSTDRAEDARAAERAGANYIGCGAVFATSTKPEAAAERIGTRRLDEVARAVNIPVIGIGGIGPHNVSQVAATRAAGAAVISALMGVSEVGPTTRRLLAAFERSKRSS